MHNNDSPTPPPTQKGNKRHKQVRGILQKQNLPLQGWAEARKVELAKSVYCCEFGGSLTTNNTANSNQSVLKHVFEYEENGVSST